MKGIIFKGVRNKKSKLNPQLRERNNNLDFFLFKGLENNKAAVVSQESLL